MVRCVNLARAIRRQKWRTAVWAHSDRRGLFTRAMGAVDFSEREKRCAAILVMVTGHDEVSLECASPAGGGQRA